MSAIDPDGLKTTLVMTRDYGFATRTALHLTNSGSPVLCDPSGSYLSSRRGSGDTFGENDADLNDFIKYHTNMGSYILACATLRKAEIGFINECSLHFVKYISIKVLIK